MLCLKEKRKRERFVGLSVKIEKEMEILHEKWAVISE